MLFLDRLLEIGFQMQEEKFHRLPIMIMLSVIASTICISRWKIYCTFNNTEVEITTYFAKKWMFSIDRGEDRVTQCENCHYTGGKQHAWHHKLFSGPRWQPCGWYLEEKRMLLIGVAVNAKYSLRTLSVKFCRDGLVVTAWGCERRPLPPPKCWPGLHIWAVSGEWLSPGNKEKAVAISSR